MRKIDEVCRKYQVSSVTTLEIICHDVDQERMKSKVWDYKNTTSLDTRIVRDLERVTRSDLTEDERWRVEQMIWMWYHHAVSCAIYKYRDREAALCFVHKALEHQSRIPNHPNKITSLFLFLLNGKLKKARESMKRMSRIERNTAQDIISEWEKQSPFDQS
jgi:hypothetical protein